MAQEKKLGFTKKKEPTPEELKEFAKYYCNQNAINHFDAIIKSLIDEQISKLQYAIGKDKTNELVAKFKKEAKRQRMSNSNYILNSLRMSLKNQH